MAVADTINLEKKAKNAITSNFPQLNDAVSINDAVFRDIVLSSVKYRLITESFSKEILETDKAIKERATGFIYSILGVVGLNHKHLDTFLLVLHDEGGITGSEIAEMIAKDYGHDLPKYKTVVLTVNKVPMTQVLINDNESTGEVTIDNSACSVCTTEQLPNIAVQAKLPSDISPECLQMKFNDDDLLVSLALKNHKVEDVARYFGMEDYLSQIEESKSDSSKIVSILSMWRKMKEGDATYLAIIEILVQNGRTEVAKSIAISVHKRYSTLSHFHDNDESAFKPELSYPNWNDLDKSQQEIIKNDLKNENVTIVSLFCDIFMDSLESMDKQPTVNFRHIRLFLKKEHENQLTSESLIDLKQINDVTGIFEFMDDVGCNWFNFTLLDKFMSRYGSDEDKQRVYDYAVKLWDYLQRSLYRIPPESFGPSQIPPDQAYHFLLLLVDGKDITANGQQVKWVQSKLAEELKISLDSIKIKIEHCSIIIHFIVNKKLFTIDDERFALFAKHEKIDNIYYIDVDWLKYFPYNNETLPKEMCLCGYIDDLFSCLLQEYSGRLSQITLPYEIVHLLYMEGVIDKETFDRVESSEGHLMNESFRALRSAVYLDHNQLRVFASVLLRLEDTVPIANDILQESLISGLVNPILKWTFPRNDSVSNLPFLIKSNDEDNSLSSLLDEFISFINSVMPLIAGGLSSLDGLKSFLGRVYAEMRPQLAHAQSITDALILVIKNCSLINVSCLEAVINHSNIEPAQVQLSNYTVKMNEFCSNTTCSQCVEVSFRVFSSHLLICDTIQFTLYPNKVADETLDDVRSLMDESFGYLAKKVYIESIMIIEELVAVSCYVPHYITNSLQSKISCNKKVMTAKILIFSIAGSILWDHSTPVINADVISSIKGEVADKSTQSNDSDNNCLKESQHLVSKYLSKFQHYKAKYEQLIKEDTEEEKNDISVHLKLPSLPHGCTVDDTALQFVDAQADSARVEVIGNQQGLKESEHLVSKYLSKYQYYKAKYEQLINAEEEENDISVHLKLSSLPHGCTVDNISEYFDAALQFVDAQIQIKDVTVLGKDSARVEVVGNQQDIESIFLQRKQKFKRQPIDISILDSTTIKDKSSSIAGFNDESTSIADHDDKATKFNSVSINEEDYIFLKGLGSSIVKLKHPNVELQFDDSNHSVTLFGSIRDVDELKLKLEEYLIHSKVRVNVSSLAISFLQSTAGRSIIQNLSQSLKLIPCFCDDSLMLLSTNELASQAETVASKIANGISTCNIPLPQSFHSAVNSSLFGSFQHNLMNNYHFHVAVTQHQLTIVSTIDVITNVKDAFTTFINEKCSTINVDLNKGVWRLFNSKMGKSWSVILNDMEERKVTIESQSKPTAQNPSIILKGEICNVEAVAEKILALQSSVKMLQVPISCPGIRQFFNSNNGQMILRGVENEAKVCIVLEEIKEQNDTLTSFATPNQNFSRVCFGSTPEFKVINIFVGDITEFHGAEVIVNAANEDLKHFGGVALAIAKKGGPQIQKESDEYIASHGKVFTGNAVIFTNTGDLPPSYKAIVHAVGPRWTSRESDDRKIALLKKAILQSLTKAKGCSSIAIPAVSSGIYGFPVNVCADALLQAVISFSREYPTSLLNEFNFVIIEDNIDAFIEAAQKNVKNVRLQSVDEGTFTVALESKIIIRIYGETDQSVKTAEKKLTKTLQSISEDITDKNISFLSDFTLKEFETLASNHNVEINIDRDPAKCSIKLFGSLQNVFIVKNKICDKLSTYYHKQAFKKAAGMLYNTINWLKQTSNLNEDEELYPEDLNFKIEQSYQKYSTAGA